MKKLTFLLALFCIYTTSYAQHAYFNTTKDDIEKVAKKDGFRVSTEIKMVGETMNIIYYLTKDDVVIRVGYVPNMDRPAYIHYREE